MFLRPNSQNISLFLFIWPGLRILKKAFVASTELLDDVRDFQL